MKSKKISLFYLIMSIVLLAGSIAMIVVATVNSSKYGKTDYSHNIKIKEVVADDEPAENNVLHYSVILEGDIKNNTKTDMKLVSVELTLSGVNNKTGEYVEFPVDFVMENLDAEGVIEMDDESIKVGNRSGFIPQTIKEVKISVNGIMTVIPFEENTDANLLLFAGAIVVVFVAGVMFVKWINSKKSVAPKKDEEKINEEGVN